MFEKYKNVCGIYMITFPNNKSYIGLSSNIQKRLLTHKKTNDLLPVHRAIAFYGLKEEFVQVLETLETIDRKLLQEKEKYWIEKFNTYHEGYNLTLGGDGAYEGVDNISAKLNQESLQSLYQDLIENKVFIKDLSKKYNLSAEAISEINNGRRYYNQEYNYPLRQPTHFTSEQMKEKRGTDKESSLFNKEQLEQIIEELKKDEKTIVDIAKEFHCNKGTIHNINKGIHYYNENIDYPIRKHIVRKTKIDKEKLNEIIDLLINSNLNYSEIGRRFGVNSTTIARINSGKIQHQNNICYPIRKE